MEVTTQARRESYLALNPEGRQKQILDVLSNGKEMTAREIAYALNYYDLNAVKPRLTELCQKDKIEACGKKKDPYTNKSVAVYRRVEDDQ